MQIVNAKAEYIDTSKLGLYQMIEKAGRTCYKSEANITDESAVKFVQNLVKNQHTAMLEHAHIYMELNEFIFDQLMEAIGMAQYANGYDWEDENEPFWEADTVSPFIKISRVVAGDDSVHYYISGSFRTFLNMFYDMDGCFSAVEVIMDELHSVYPEIFQHESSQIKVDRTQFVQLLTRDEFIKRISSFGLDDGERDMILEKHLTHTIVFTCDRGVSHEFVRHRTASFAQESTRYCNYSQDKFHNEISVIKPCYWKENTTTYMQWKTCCEMAEVTYFALLDAGATPQEARSVLPTSLKTELVITATEQEWQHIINLRYHGTTGKPHPQMYESMSQAYPLLVKYSDNRLK